MEKLKESVQVENLYPGLYCFVTFKTRSMLFDFLRRTSKSFISLYILDPITHFLCCNKTFRNILIVKDNIINTQRAP